MPTLLPGLATTACYRRLPLTGEPFFTATALFFAGTALRFAVTGLAALLPSGFPFGATARLAGAAFSFVDLAGAEAALATTLRAGGAFAATAFFAPADLVPFAGEALTAPFVPLAVPVRPGGTVRVAAARPRSRLAPAFEIRSLPAGPSLALPLPIVTGRASVARFSGLPAARLELPTLACT